MMGRKAIIAAIAVALAAAAFFVLTRSKPVPAPATPVMVPAVSGNYADDWQTKCGPLTGPAQSDCTANLDAAYGHQAEQPVPKY